VSIRFRDLLKSCNKWKDFLTWKYQIVCKGRGHRGNMAAKNWQSDFLASKSRKNIASAKVKMQLARAKSVLNHTCVPAYLEDKGQEVKSIFPHIKDTTQPNTMQPW